MQDPGDMRADVKMPVRPAGNRERGDKTDFG